MPQIQLPDSLYNDAQKKASAAGFGSVDAYVAEVLSQELVSCPDDDLLFTPERLAEIDGITAALDAGAKLHSDEQMSQYFDRKRQEWLKKNAR